MFGQLWTEKHTCASLEPDGCSPARYMEQAGLPAAYKARWVAKGYSEVNGPDYNEFFASVAHKDSNRVFLSVVNHLDLECDQVDITVCPKQCCRQCDKSRILSQSRV